MTNAISRNYTSVDYLFPLNDDQMIEVFVDRTRGWFLQIIDSLEAIPHSGFGVLLMVTSYFEFIAQCECGTNSEGKSQKFFKDGLRSVYGSTFSEDQLTRLYKELRCGLFHAVFPKTTVVISGDFPQAIEFVGEGLSINPHKLLEDVRRHFSRYCLRLHDKTGVTLRANLLVFVKQS